MPPFSSSSSSSLSQLYSVGLEEHEGPATNATTTDVNVVEREESENFIIDSDDDYGMSEEEEESIEDEGFVDFEVGRYDYSERNAVQMRSLFMELKGNLMFDVCYNCTLDRTKITNFRICCEELECDFDEFEILAFVCALIGVRGKMDETENPIIPGYHKEDAIKAAFLRFFQEFVMCQECGHKMERAGDLFTFDYLLEASCPICFFKRKVNVTPEVE